MHLFCFLSGGVDSSVATKLAMNNRSFLNASFIGASHINWPESKCCEANSLRQCELFCQELNIPYYKIDCVIPFCKKVVNNFCETYFNGETPNPCVICNEKIRFDFMVNAIFEKLQIKFEDDFKIVTGHYAQLEFKNNQWFLKKGIDTAKDQSYMLYRLNQAQLSHCYFPLGSLKKSEVRELAEKWQVFSAKYSDSQDACFLNQPYTEFIVNYLEKEPTPGIFIDKKQNILGEHKGVIYYTRGQRKGLNLPNGPWFVSKIDAKQNKVQLARKDDLLINKFKVKKLNWIYLNLPQKFECMVATRYHAEEIPCEVEYQKQSGIVRLTKPHFDVSPGQSAVFYDGEYVIGGGEISL